MYILSILSTLLDNLYVFFHMQNNLISLYSAYLIFSIIVFNQMITVPFSPLFTILNY